MGRGNNRFNRNRHNFHRNRKPNQNQKASHSDNEPRNASKNCEQAPRKSLKEIDVGITEFVSKIDGFTGVLKARFSDFHVNEIDLDGNEVKLTNQDLPIAPDDAMGVVKLEKNKKDLETILTQDIWIKIDSLLKGSDMVASVDIDVTSLEKNRRTSVHKTLKEVYGNKIISTTDTINEKKFISCSKASGNHTEKRTRWVWPEEYVYFVVHKENTDTLQAALDIASALRMPPSSVNYAGTKDKRAKTTQRFCVKKREPEHILKNCRRIPYIKIGNFELKSKVLKLGDLKGNRFRIVLRHVDGDNEKIVKSLENMKSNGFINYYGLQRFGNCSTIPTYQIGIALLKADYKEAAELILKPRDGDLYFIKQARELWWKNRNSAEAAEMIKNTKFIEKKLLDGLAKYGENDYANALRRIPRNMLLLYTHSFQSLIWNQVASLRIAKYGLQLIPGDLVLRDQDENIPEIIDTAENAILEEDEQLRSEDVEKNDDSEKTDDQIAKISIFKQKVRPLTEADIKSNRYSIFDILLPLPGYDVAYPENEIHSWYKALMEEHDLTSEKLKSNVKTYSLLGAYRKLLIKPQNMSWEFKRYDLPTSVLIQSDFEAMRNLPADDDKPEGKLNALLLDFILPAASYATMALREILKADTSSMSQARIEETEMKKFEEDNDIENKRKSSSESETVETKKMKLEA